MGHCADRMVSWVTGCMIPLMPGTPNRTVHFPWRSGLVDPLLRPLRFVGRCAGRSLRFAWLVHLLGLLVFVTFSLIVALLNPLWLSYTDGQYVGTWQFSNPLIGVSLTAADLVGLFFGFVFLEIGWVICAAVSMAWGARDESIRESFVRALHHLWLLTPCLAMILVAIQLASDALMSLRLLGWDLWGGSYSLTGYQLWVIIEVMVVYGGAVWAIGLVLRALDVGRPGPACRWPPMCEGCGYNLMGTDRAGGCPECGTAVADSIDPDARRGVGPGFSFRGILKPSAIGKQTPLLTRPPGLGWLLTQYMLTVLLLAILFVVIVVLFVLLVVEGNPIDLIHHLPSLLSAGLLIGGWVTGCSLVLTLLGASCIGAIQSVHNKRNLMPVAMVAAVHLGGWWVIGETGLWLIAIALTLIAYTFSSSIPGTGGGMGPIIFFAMVAGLVCLGFICLIVLCYLAQLWRCVRFARYANV